MKFNKNQLEIIERCNEKNACEEEFIKLINSKTNEDFWKVINKNLIWVLTNRIITDRDFSKVKDMIFVYDNYKYLYCLHIKDRKELWKSITDDVYKYRYCRDVKDRKELK